MQSAQKLLGSIEIFSTAIRMLEFIAKWSRQRLAVTLAISFLSIVEFVGALATKSSTCLVALVHDECPNFHMFLFERLDLLFEAFQAREFGTVVAGVAILIILWELVGWIIHGSITSGDPVVQNGPDKKNLSFWRPIASFYHTEAVARFTLLLVGVGVLQLLALDKTDETLRLQGRAWIAPRGFSETPANIRSPKDLYTEATLGFENVGKEPAIKVAEEIHPIAYPLANWHNSTAILKVVRTALGSRECKDIPLNSQGRVVWPGTKPGRVVGFSATDIAKINARSHYAMLAGCIAYETLKSRHYTEVCVILEPIAQDGGWRSTNCPIHNQAN